jgi:hypothetical protein
MSMKATRKARTAALLVGCAAAAWATVGARAAHGDETHQSIVARAQVWNPTDIPAMDLKAGPQGEGAFPFRATVVCDYDAEKFEGRSPKFACDISKGDRVKVKFGGPNGEVYGEVLATRLLWALGFGADRMYPVTVICRGCPDSLGGIERPGGEMRFDPAVIERKMSGKEWSAKGRKGWSWNELGAVDSANGGAPRAQRDALTLLAVFMQHTDSKPQQQRILCLGAGPHRSSDSCSHPFLMISDLGLTFGRANRRNTNDAGSVNLVAWRKTPTWKDGTGCTGNLPKSLTGTLDNPAISEEGRSFLASLLVQLSDGQIRDLFEVARVELRFRAPGDMNSGFATVDEWVQAFKDKRDQIVERRCLPARAQ